MRSIKVIEADIAKLNAELADVKDHEQMRDSAVHILKNLGWTRQKGLWVKPNPKMVGIDFDSLIGIDKSFKYGDIVSVINSHLPGRQKYIGKKYYIVRVSGVTAYAKEIVRMSGVPAYAKEIVTKNGEGFLCKPEEVALNVAAIRHTKY